MLPVDPYLGMKIVDQYRREAEREADAFRMWRDSGMRRPRSLERLGRGLLARAGVLLSALGSWLQGEGLAGGLPLDGQMRSSG
jgi:hypothetical protein